MNMMSNHTCSDRPLPSYKTSIVVTASIFTLFKANTKETKQEVARPKAASPLLRWRPQAASHVLWWRPQALAFLHGGVVRLHHLIMCVSNVAQARSSRFLNFTTCHLAAMDDEDKLRERISKLTRAELGELVVELTRALYFVTEAAERRQPQRDNGNDNNNDNHNHVNDNANDNAHATMSTTTHNNDDDEDDGWLWLERKDRVAKIKMGTLSTDVALVNTNPVEEC